MSSARSEAKEAGSPDFRDLLQVFADFRVRYLIVGAYAVAYYTEPRFTKDLDVWVDPLRSCGNCAPAVIANPASGGVKQSPSEAMVESATEVATT